jgi:PAS domain S-box-containing protein
LEVFEAYKGMYEYEYLPAYAQYLLDNHLEDYARQQITLSRALKLPVLKSLEQRFTEQQIIDIAINSSREYLQFIAANKGKEQIITAMTRWMSDQLNVVGQAEIGARDITLLNYIRGQTLKKFLVEFAKDVERVMQINAEIDLLLLGSSTTSADTFIDILREKIAEQSKLASKLIEASPAITFLYDTKNNKQIFISGKVKEVLGYTSDELMHMEGNSFLQLLHPRDLEVMIAHMRSLLEENRNDTSQVEFRFRHQDGNYRWLRSYQVIFSRDASGEPEYVLGKTFEITAEKETAIALEKRESQLLEAQSLAHIGNYEWNIVEHKSFNSMEVYRIFEMEGEQRYEEFMTHVHPDDVQKVKDAIAQSFITGRYECEYRFVKNGKEKVIWSIGRVEFRNEEPYRMIGTVQDVTEIKKMERQLMQKSAELAQSNESLRQFAFVASHDMKEPLRKIMMFSDLVLNNSNNKLTEKSVMQLQKMRAAGKSLYRMVEDILSFSLLEVKEEKEEVSLKDLVKDVIEMLEEPINEKKAAIIYDGLPRASVITSQFRQLFQNLISNSLKFQKKETPPRIIVKGEITTNPSIKPLVVADKYLALTVSDNGIGFPKDMSEKIFELFSRLYSKAEYEGTGLGLSISKRIVENHRGVITASSADGKGATFTIVVPQ